MIRKSDYGKKNKIQPSASRASGKIPPLAKNAMTLMGTPYKRK